MGYHVNIMQCMQHNFILTGQVYPMLMSSVLQAWGTLDWKRTLFKLIVKCFVKSVVFMLWHDVVYIELLYYVTNFKLVWTWNKVAVVENAKKLSIVPTFPYLSCLTLIRCIFHFSFITCETTSVRNWFVLATRLAEQLNHTLSRQTFVLQIC